MKQPRIFEMALIQHQVCNRFIKPLYNFYCLILQLFSFLTKELYLNVKIEKKNDANVCGGTATPKKQCDSTARPKCRRLFGGEVSGGEK